MIFGFALRSCWEGAVGFGGTGVHLHKVHSRRSLPCLTTKSIPDSTVQVAAVLAEVFDPLSPCILPICESQTNCAGLDMQAHQLRWVIQALHERNEEKQRINDILLTKEVHAHLLITTLEVLSKDFSAGSSLLLDAYVHVASRHCSPVMFHDCKRSCSQPVTCDLFDAVAS